MAEVNQRGRWVEYCLELYSKEDSIIKEAFDIIEGLRVLEELYSESTKEDLGKDTDALICTKPCGKDCILQEIR